MARYYSTYTSSSTTDGFVLPTNAADFETQGYGYVGSSTYIGDPKINWVANDREKEGTMLCSGRGLFEVFIVDPEEGDILGPYRVIATDEMAAKVKVAARQLDPDKADFDDFDIIVRRLGDVRPKKVIQSVHIENRIGKK